MFLHEPGEEKDSFTRQDLSSINVASTQRSTQPAAATSNSSATAPARAGPHPTHSANSHPPAHDGGQATSAPVPSAMGRESSKEGASSTDGNDGSALPSSASWAAKGLQQQQSRRESRAASSATPSPKVAIMDIGGSMKRAQKEEPSSTAHNYGNEDSSKDQIEAGIQHVDGQAQTAEQHNGPALGLLPALSKSLLEAVTSPHFRFNFAKDMFTAEEYDAIMQYPPLFQWHGGAKLRAIREEDARRKREQEIAHAVEPVSEAQSDDVLSSGSLQLGGEPEGRRNTRGSLRDLAARGPQQQSVQTSSHQVAGGIVSQDGGYRQPRPSSSAISNLTLNGRGLTPSQQQHLLLLKSSNPQQGGLFDQFSHNSAQTQSPHSDLLQNQTHQLMSQGHARQASRFTFTQDTGSVSAAVKPAASAKIMAQQAAMMPPASNNFSQAAQNHHNQPQPQQNAGAQLYNTTMAGPPPGLKVTGGALFGQQASFTGSLNNHSMSGLRTKATDLEREAEHLRDMLRFQNGLTGVGGGHGPDGGKREFVSPFSQQYTSTSTPVSASSVSGPNVGLQPALYQDYSSQKQKKKGKKHRHANTSSSGGGGVVDLADPSILQARMQQQSSHGLGQALYGNQGQGGFSHTSTLYGGGINRW